MHNGKLSDARNGNTKSVFGKTLEIDMTNSNQFPLITGRKMFYKGIFGEFAAFLKGPTSVKDFEDEGCNYWAKWARPDGELSLDYGNKWTHWEGVNQLAITIETLRGTPHGRRHLINAWDPYTVHNDTLDLPCCHYGYQWYVTASGHLDMIWIQRSVDLMIGLPSDIVLAALFNIMMAKLTGYKPGKIVMQLGDCHVYEEHERNAATYTGRVLFGTKPKYPTYNVADFHDYWDFANDTISINDYNSRDAIKFELKE